MNATNQNNKSLKNGVFLYVSMNRLYIHGWYCIHWILCRFAPLGSPGREKHFLTITKGVGAGRGIQVLG